MATAKLKIGVMLEGLEAKNPTGKQYLLVNKAAQAGYLCGQAFRERGAARFAQRHDRTKVGRTVIDGEGAK